MGGKFRKYSIVTCEDALYQMYVFVQSSGQNVIRFVTDGGTPAIYKAGTGYVASFASSEDCPDGSYIVIEPVTANGGVRWQLRIKNDAANTLKATFAPDGGWGNGGAGPGSFSGVQTNETTFNDGSAPAASSEIWCGTNTVSYNSGNNLWTYVWFNVRDGATAPDQMVWAGGFTPFNPAQDTKPATFLARIPLTDSQANKFGYNDPASLCRCASEFAHSTTWTTSGQARIGISDTPVIPGNTSQLRTLSGSEYIALPMYLFSNTGGYIHGHFADQLLAIDGARSDYDTNTAVTYVVLGHCLAYYNESL